ncbi:MAG: Uma2 family endonuclease [Bacteroidota bacterium]
MTREPHIIFPLQHRLINVSEYYQMAEAGIIRPAEKVELLFGKILSMRPVGVRHALCVKLIMHVLSNKLPEDIALSVQDPIRLDNHSEPEPDLAIIKGPLRRYIKQHPGPKDILLVIEVADSSFEKDLHYKLPLYAQAGIPHCWIVDLNKNQVHVFSEPAGEQYKFRQILGVEEEVKVVPLDISLPVKDIL